MTTPDGNALAHLQHALVRQAAWIGRWAAIAIVLPILGVGLVQALPELLQIAQALSSTRMLRFTTALAAFAVFATATWLARRRQPLPAVAFVIATTLAGACLRYAYATSVHPEWTSDFLTYWTVAAGQVETGDFRATSLYTERTLPVLVPLIALFGAEKINVVVANIAMLAMVQLAGYDILRRLHSHQAAQAFTVAFLAAPIPYFASTIPSHDLWAMWLIALALWIASIGLGGGRRYWKAITLASAIPLALLCLLLEIQRGVGNLLALSLAVSAVLAWMFSRGRVDPAAPPRAGFFALACAGVLLLQAPLGMLASQLELRAAQSPAHQAYLAGYYASNGTSLGNGTYGWMREFRTDFTDALEANDAQRLRSFSRSIILSDWAEQPAKRVGNVALRMRGLFVLDNSNYWYFRGVDPALERPLGWLRAYSGFFSLFFAGGMLLAMARMLLGVNPSAPVLCGLVLTALTTLALGSFSENQPRYLLWLWFTGHLFVAEMLGRGRAPPALSVRRATVLALAVVAGWLILLILLWLPVRTLYDDVDGRMLSDWTYPATGSPAGAFSPAAGANPYKHVTDPGHLAVSLYPGNKHGVEHRVCLGKDGPLALSLYVVAQDVTSGDTLKIRYAGHELQTVALAPATGKIVEVHTVLPGTPESCSSLELQMQAQSTASDSRTDIYFARLEPTAQAPGTEMR